MSKRTPTADEYDAWAAAQDAQRDANAAERRFERTGNPYDYDNMVAAQQRTAEAEERFDDALRAGRR